MDSVTTMGPIGPREEPGKWGALLLTFLMHGVLVLLLFYGVQWQRHVPEPVQVELVRSLPEPAVEPPPPPPLPVEPPKPVEPPPQVKPDIALTDPKVKPREEKPKPPQSSSSAASRQPPSRIQDNERLNTLLNLSADTARRAAAQQANASARAAQVAQQDGIRKAQNEWKGVIQAKVLGNFTAAIPPDVTGKPNVEFTIELLPSGEVTNVKLSRSSGSSILDKASERAIWKSSPLPKPSSPDAFDRNLKFVFYPLGQ